MRWMIRTLAVIVLAVTAVAAIGWTLPAEHIASRGALYPQPIEPVFAAVEAAFRVEQERGGIPIAVVARDPPRRLVTRIADADLPFGGTWTFDLTPEGGGTRVTITEHGEISHVVFRVMARYVYGYTATLERFLTAVGRRLGDGAGPASGSPR